MIATGNLQFSIDSTSVAVNWIEVGAIAAVVVAAAWFVLWKWGKK